MSLAETAELAVRISLDDRMSPALGRVNRQLGVLNMNAGKIGRGTGQIGRGLVRAGERAFIGLTAVIGGAIAEAVRFEDAMAGVEKVLSEEELAKVGGLEALGQQFRDLSTIIPVTAEELARIGQEAGALGLRVQDIAPFSEIVAELAATTKLTADVASESLGKVGTILGLTGDKYREFADTLINLGNKGAATEDEILQITMRFAAAGKQAGLTANQILALSSAAASLGLMPEAAGGALSRIFFQLSSNIGLANKKGEVFAKTLGITMKEAKQRLNKGETLPMLMEFMTKLRGMSKTGAGKLLYNAGIRNVRDRDVILKFAQRIDEVKRQLGVADSSAGALAETANKRFDTVLNKIKLVWNNLMEGARIFGTETLPAIAEKLDEVIGFLQRDDVKNQLREWGKEAASFIRSIDLEKLLAAGKSLVDGLGPAVDIVHTLATMFLALPDQIKGAAIAFGGLNMASGGLIGAGLGNALSGIIGGSIRSAFAMLPGFGRIGAMPVYVTNMPLGGMGGAGGAAGTAGGLGGKLGKVLGILGVIGAGLAVFETQQQISGASTAQAKGIQSNLNSNVGSMSNAQMATALAGVNQGIKDLRSNPLHVLVQGDALTVLQQMQSDLQGRLERKTAPVFREGERQSADGGTNTKLDTLREKLASVINQQAAAERNGQEGRARRLEAKADGLRAKIAEESARQQAATRANTASTAQNLAGVKTRLDGLIAKPTNFRSYVTVNTSVSISSIQQHARYKERVTKPGSHMEVS